jgi:hypothetical protein
MTDVVTAKGEGAAHDAGVLIIDAKDIGAVERALAEARTRQDEELPQRVLAGLIAKRAKFQALVEATDAQIALAKAGQL